ncbi:MAG: hypothetical protein JNK76_02360 [Planctomycetales bacterium]|nr:hypothetical protein [Planctomycetales bacterium]MBN8627845.1 hypothetical protein [Planctomycetota bacterium]
MESSIGSALERLQRSAEALNSVCDEAAETVRQAESFLSACRVGIRAWVQIGSDEDGNESFLEYMRIGKNFRIAITYIVDGESGTRPWSDCSREEKLESFAKLPDLLLEIAARVDQKIQQSKATVESVRKSIKAKDPYHDI